MNSKQFGFFGAGATALAILFLVTSCATSVPYTESAEGRYLYLNPFAHKPATPEQHWDYAASLRDEGKTEDAARQFDILVKRWPDSPEAPAARRAAADLYFAAGEYEDAFESYEELVSRYFNRIRNYDEVLERQWTLARRVLNRRRMGWLFGGYRAPKQAVPYMQSILRAAPQWERAPEIQYTIGEAWRESGDADMAIAAYSAVEYRYPDSPFAERAAFAKLNVLYDWVEKTPYSVELREQAQLAAALFNSLYPDSEHRATVRAIERDLQRRALRHNREIAAFYADTPEGPKEKAVRIYMPETAQPAAPEPPPAAVETPPAGDPTADSAQAVDEPAATDEHSAGAAGKPSPEPIAPSGQNSARPVPAEPQTGTPAAPAAVPADQEPPADADLFPDESALPPEGQQSDAGDRPVSLPERLTDDEEAVEITADRMEYTDDVMIAEGNATVQQQGASLQADRIMMNPDSGEIVAAGNIVMIRDGVRWEGPHLTYNYKDRSGDFGESTISFEPAYITAADSERVSSNKFMLRDVMITTCSGDNPAVYAKAREAEVVDNGEPGDPTITARHVVFYAGPVPVFYLPVWQRHLGHRVFTFYFGAGDRVGAFVKVRAELHPADWLTSNSHFDLYSKRGLGLGQDFLWTTPGGEGRFRSYYINDDDPVDEDDPLPEQALTDSSRYRIQIEHRETLDEQTYLMTRLNWLSDPGIIEDFFNEEYRRAANPENFAVVQRSTDEYGAALRVDHRLNDFYTTVERLPALSYDRYLTRLGDSRYYFSSENSIDRLELLHAQMPGLTNIPSDYSAARLDTYNRIFLPLKYQDYLNVIPRAGWRGTWYSSTEDGSSSLRNILELGALTSFKAHKMLSEKSAWYGTGLRHVAEPFADYTYRFEPNLRPDELYQFDDIDALDKENAVRFGVRNFLQSKRGTNRIANVLDSEVYTTLRLETLEDEDTLGPLVADAELSLTDNLWVQSNLEFDWNDQDINPFNIGVHYIADDLSHYRFRYRYRDDETDTRSLFYGSARLFPQADWFYDLGVRYDSDSGVWEERKIVVNRRFDCVAAGVGLKIDEDNEQLFWVQFWLTAFPQAKLDLMR